MLGMPQDAAYLAARWFCEPESPSVLQRMFDIEVVLVVENCNDLVIQVGGRGDIVLVAVGRDGDGGEINLFRHVG